MSKEVQLTTLLPINDLLTNNQTFNPSHNITEVDEDITLEIQKIVRNTGSAQYRPKSKNNPF